jgi:hypothetical protein
MSKKLIMLFCLLAISILVLSACTPQATPAATEKAASTAVPATDVPATVVPEQPANDTDNTTTEYALKITGSVDNETGWSEDELKAMNTLDVESTNSKGETDTYTGVLISDLLNLAVPKADATTLVFVADDGFTAEIALADVINCQNCILSFRSKGGFSSVLPEFEKNLQVKGVIEMQVK